MKKLHFPTFVILALMLSLSSIMLFSQGVQANSEIKHELIAETGNGPDLYSVLAANPCPAYVYNRQEIPRLSPAEKAGYESAKTGLSIIHYAVRIAINQGYKDDPHIA